MTWILIQNDPDAHGFVAHHLDMDVVARGDTPRGALIASLRAVDDAGGVGLAPEEFHEATRAVAKLGTKTTLEEPWDAWAVRAFDGPTGTTESVTGLHLKDHPGLVLPVAVPA